PWLQAGLRACGWTGAWAPVRRSRLPMRHLRHRQVGTVAVCDSLDSLTVAGAAPEWPEGVTGFPFQPVGGRRRVTWNAADCTPCGAPGCRGRRYGCHGPATIFGVDKSRARDMLCSSVPAVATRRMKREAGEATPMRIGQS